MRSGNPVLKDSTFLDLSTGAAMASGQFAHAHAIQHQEDESFARHGFPSPLRLFNAFEPQSHRDTVKSKDGAMTTCGSEHAPVVPGLFLEQIRCVSVSTGCGHLRMEA